MQNVLEKTSWIFPFLTFETTFQMTSFVVPPNDKKRRGGGGDDDDEAATADDDDADLSKV